MFGNVGHRPERRRDGAKSSTAVFGRRASSASAASLLEELSGDDLNNMIGFITGTTLVAGQTTAPTGWTKGSTHNDKMIRLVTGTVTTGGATAFSTVFASRSPTGSFANAGVTDAQHGAHTHESPTNSNSLTFTVGGAVSASTSGAGAITTGAAGSGTQHSHTWTGTAMDFAIQFVDCIIISKN